MPVPLLNPVRGLAPGQHLWGWQNEGQHRHQGSHVQPTLPLRARYAADRMTTRRTRAPRQFLFGGHLTKSLFTSTKAPSLHRVGPGLGLCIQSRQERACLGFLGG